MDGTGRWRRIRAAATLAVIMAMALALEAGRRWA
jgi:hypothetical protein